ncbi:hypothetical protein GGR52DRAFT_238156 [Hypoxylon sp. FL1284]|nr:hypothetical protein GGR52DRAFT_238156 [Hypoxylon sp. FL1284]
MSSMLKKKAGGLSFKPNLKAAPRRPAGIASSSQASTDKTTSQTSTNAPVTTAPAASSAESLNQETGTTANEIPKEPPTEVPEVVTARPSTAQPAAAVEPTTESPESTESATFPTTPAVTGDESPRQETSTSTPTSLERVAQPASPQQTPPASIPPATGRTAHPTPAPEVTALETPPATSTPHPPSVANLPTPEPPIQAQEMVAPPTAPPSPVAVSDTIAVSAPADNPPTAAAKSRAPRKRNSTTEGNADAEDPPKKRRAPRKKTTTEGDGTAPAEDGERAQSANKAPRRRRRSPTPDRSETVIIDHGTMKMAELTQDLGIGKRFKHADAIEDRAREARAKNRLKRLEKQKRRLGLLPEEESASRASTPAEGADNGRDSVLARARELGASAADADHTVGYDVVNGQIIINQQSLIVDRHAAHRDMSTLETVEEDDFSHATTCVSFRRESRKTGPNHWTDEETEKFYRLLSMFGTDFETIASMFPEKSRRAVKLKFNREENLRPRRIDAAVMVRGEKQVGIDLEEYKSHQQGWQESDKIKAEHAELVREHEEDIRRLREERRAAGLLDEEDEDEAVDGGAQQAAVAQDGSA